MFIKKIKLLKYGKLKDFNVNLDEGINIVYGENEAGKSTMQSFISNSLYGISNKRSKDIRQNDRAKLLPFGEGSAAGEIGLNVDGRSVIISRTFGTTKKDDTVKAVDGITGEEDSTLSFDAPGEKILNISRSSFNNTLFINQLGSTVTKAKDDEIMTKITALFQAGDEEVSYDKSITKLNEMKKLITTSRKSGKLDMMKARLSSLLEEKHKRMLLSQENVDDEMKHIDLQEHREFLLKEIKKLELYKKYMKKTKLEKEYKDIISYLKKSQQLKKDKENVDKELSYSEGEITLANIEDIKDELDNIEEIKNILEEKENMKQKLISEMDDKESIIDNLAVFNDLPEDIEQKIIKVNIENNELKKRLATIEEIKSSILSINKDLEKYNLSREQNMYLTKRRHDIDEMLKEYEAELRSLESLMTNSTSIGTKTKSDVAGFTMISRMLCAAAVSLSLIAVFIISKKSLMNIMSMLMIIASLSSIAAFVVIKRKLDKMKLDLAAAVSYEKSVSEKKENIEFLEDNIDEICSQLDISDYKELMMLLKKFDRIQIDMGILNEKKRDKENFLSSLDENNTIAKLKENQKAVQFLLTTTKSHSIDDFVDKFHEFNDVKAEIKLLYGRIDSIKREADREKEIYSKKYQTLKNKLNSMRIYAESYEEIMDSLSSIKEKINLKHELEISLKNTVDTYKVLLQDRDISRIEEEVKQFIDNDISYSYESEDEIEREIKEKNNDLIETEKNLKDVENNIKNIFLTNRDLNVIEEEILNVKDKIETEEANLCAIETASEVITESFKEMQKNFGPVINKSVGKYMSALTDDKYQKVKVSENYSITLRNGDDSLMQAEYLSNGTWDQIYLALRLSFIDLIFGDTKVPIILDEAFVQYDDKRMQKALELLYSMKEKRQIIIFTCQKREVDYLSKYNDVNFINL